MNDQDVLPMPLAGSSKIPAFEHARVRDALHVGVITCLPDTPIEAVARIMTTNHVHAVVIAGVGGLKPWGVVTDRDVLAVAGDAADRTAAACVNKEVVTVAPDDPLELASALMLRHGLSHLLVADTNLDVPIGLISTLDIAEIVAWGRG
jgi:CBS domain-containing protein